MIIQDQISPILLARVIASLSPVNVIYAFLVPKGLSIEVNIRNIIVT